MITLTDYEYLVNPNVSPGVMQQHTEADAEHVWRRSVQWQSVS